MPRKRLDASDETTRLTMRLTKHQVELLDRHRGDLSRSAYLRSLITASVLVEPKPAKPAIMIVPQGRHLHRFKAQGEPIGYHQGKPIYLKVCECGLTKEE